MTGDFRVATLEIWNFRGIRRLTLPLGRSLHVFIGRNGAGKTTVLDAIARGLRQLAYVVHERVDPEDAVRFQPRDHYRHGQDEPGVAIDTTGFGWAVLGSATGFGEAVGVATWGGMIAQLGPERGVLPVFAYYGSERRVIGAVEDLGVPPVGRLAALDGCLSASARFSDVVDWFAALENAELREARDRGDVNYRDPRLTAVRDAISAMIPHTRGLQYDPERGELTVEFQGADGQWMRFALTELAGGLQVMVALVADLARRMVQANPGLGRKAPAIVLIDELDLHIHPAWQGELVTGLQSAFPNTQLLVTTHSEQIVAAVPSACVVALSTGPAGVVAEAVPPVEGAAYERVLERALGVVGRRPRPAQELLKQYWDLILTDQATSAEGVALRRRLDDLFEGEEPELTRADFEIRLRQARRAAS